MSRVWARFMGVLALAIILYLGWDFSQRIGMSLRLQQSEKAMASRVIQAEATHTALEDQKKRVQSNDFVEEYVRRNWHWAREGEIVVIAQITPAAPSPTPRPTTPISEPPWWQGLYDFLFGP